MSVDATPRQSFSIGSLHSGDFMSVRAAADEGRTRLGLFERILDCVSDWVFSSDRAECKQCLLDFSSSHSSALEKLEAFRRLQVLAGPNYADKFSVILSEEKIQDLLIKVDLPELEFFSSTTSQNCIIAEHISQWGSELDWKELAKSLDELEAPDATADEKFAFFKRLRSSVNADYKDRFYETNMLEDKKYMFGIDLKMDPVNDFLVHGENFKYRELDSIQEFKEIFIEVVKAPLTVGAAQQFEKDIQRQALYINGDKFEFIPDEIQKDTVVRFDRTLKDNGFTADEILMTKKIFIQTTMNEFHARAISGIHIIGVPGNNPVLSHSVSNRNQVFETESYLKFTPLSGQSIGKREKIMDAYRPVLETGSILNEEKPALVTDRTHQGRPGNSTKFFGEGALVTADFYQGWPTLESKRKKIVSFDTEFKISMRLMNPEAQPEVSIEAKFGEYIGPINYPRGGDAPAFFDKA